MNSTVSVSPTACAIVHATMELRWKLSATPGGRPILQQLFTLHTIDRMGYQTEQTEEWRDVPFVDWNENPVV